jgi:hypothetical protein
MSSHVTSCNNQRPYVVLSFHLLDEIEFPLSKNIRRHSHLCDYGPYVYPELWMTFLVAGFALFYNQIMHLLGSSFSVSICVVDLNFVDKCIN